MKIKTTDLKNSDRPDRIYEKPEVRAMELTSEGLLCMSTTIQVYEEEEFKW